ncbi:hypothetical protein KY284_026506 [Solanum tuberosum]|nr:hypothetical protein KY284_026506 [Solanum tuberosum]
MAPNITVTNSDANTTIVQFNPVTQLPIKLTGSHNFSLWKVQVSMLMRGHNLFGHLDGSRLAPTRAVAQNNKDVKNPTFVSLYRQDQLIQNAILASVDPNLVATVVAASTSQAAWDALHTSYANKSQTRIFSATHHMSSNAQNFTNVHTYKGPEEITMGDSNTIPISHTGFEYGGGSVSWSESRWAI